LKRGAADLAIAASMVAQQEIFFGGDLVPAVTAALHGTASFGTAAVLILWVATLAAGVVESLEGYRAAQAHRDPFDAGDFVISLAVSLACLYALHAGWSLPPEWGAFIAACSRSALLAVAAYSMAGVYLQLRGPVALLFVPRAPPRHDPLPDNSFLGDLFGRQVERQDSGAAAQLAEYREVVDGLAREVEQHRQALVTWQQERVTWQEAVAERDRAITELASERDRTISAVVAERDWIAAERNQLAAALCDVTATRDRYQSNGKRIKAEKREIETVLLLQGVERALDKALHPNAHGGKSAAELRAFNDGFVKMKAIYQRLKAER
jgi:hypothetical protein